MSPAMKLGNWLRRVCPCVRKPPYQSPQSELEKLFLRELSENEVEQDTFTMFLFRVGRLTIAAIPGFSTIDVISEEGYLGELPSKYGSLLWAEVSRQEEVKQQSRIKKLLEGEH